MPCRAATLLPKTTQNRIARPIDVDDRDQLFDLFRPDKIGLHTLQPVCVGGTQVAAHLVVGLRQHDHAARAEHDVIVQVLAHGFIQRP